jgi:hypothetical protein
MHGEGPSARKNPARSDNGYTRRAIGFTEMLNFRVTSGGEVCAQIWRRDASTTCRPVAGRTRDADAGARSDSRRHAPVHGSREGVLQALTTLGGEVQGNRRRRDAPPRAQARRYHRRRPCRDGSGARAAARRC